MSRASIESKLRQLGDRLRRARDELAVLDEQLVVFRDTAEETRVQSLVDDSALSATEYRDADRHAKAMIKSRDRLAAEIGELEQARDDLLDRLVNAR